MIDTLVQDDKTEVISYKMTAFKIFRFDLVNVDKDALLQLQQAIKGEIFKRQEKIDFIKERQNLGLKINPKSIVLIPDGKQLPLNL